MLAVLQPFQEQLCNVACTVADVTQHYVFCDYLSTEVQLHAGRLRRR